VIYRISLDKKIVISLFLLVFSLTPVFAETREIITEGEYVMGAGETMEVAEERAKKAAIRTAAEKAGAFVKSYTKIKSLALESDVIEVIANHSMKVEVLEKKKSVLGDVEAIRFYVKIKAAITEEEIEANLKKVMEDQSIVDSYNRLKADYEKQNREMEILKKQLVDVVGGDKQKIARLISEEEKKYKANLWVEKAQHLSYLEALNAYKKALELNPELAEAYVGIADALLFQTIGQPELEKKVKGLQGALANLDKAISIDENYADAYAVRVKVLGEIRDKEREIYELKDEFKDKLSEWEETKKQQYDEQILKDINRAIALNASNKADMYKERARWYEREAFSYERSSPKIGENYFDKAISDIDQAIALCKEGDLECLSKYYGVKAGIYSDAKNYYIITNNAVKDKESEELANQWSQKAQAFGKKQEILSERRESERRESERKELEQTTEIGKLSYELEMDGWQEKVLGSLKDRKKAAEGKSDEEKVKMFKEIVAKIKKRISSGIASAEDYLYMAMFGFDDSAEIRINNYAKGIALFEKRNPTGREALLLVHFYIFKAGLHLYNEQYDDALNGVNKAKIMTDKHLAHAHKLLSLNDFWQLVKTGDVEKNASALNKEEAEAVYWIQFALQIPFLRAKVYEKLDLPSKALKDYRYLCDTLKDEEACKDVKRLK